MRHEKRKTAKNVVTALWKVEHWQNQSIITTQRYTFLQTLSAKSRQGLMHNVKFFRGEAQSFVIEQGSERYTLKYEGEPVNDFLFGGTNTLILQRAVLCKAGQKESNVKKLSIRATKLNILPNRIRSVFEQFFIFHPRNASLPYQCYVCQLGPHIAKVIKETEAMVLSYQKRIGNSLTFFRPQLSRNVEGGLTVKEYWYSKLHNKFPMGVKFWRS